MGDVVRNFLKTDETTVTPWERAASLCVTPVDNEYLVSPETLRVRAVRALSTHYGYRLFRERDGETVVEALAQLLQQNPNAANSAPILRIAQFFSALPVAEQGSSAETTTFIVTVPQIRELLFYATQLTGVATAIRGTNFAATVADGIVFANNSPHQFAVAHGASIPLSNHAEHQFFVDWVTGRTALRPEPLILPEAVQLRTAIDECKAAINANRPYFKTLWFSIQQRPGRDPSLPAADNRSDDPTAILNNHIVIKIAAEEYNDEIAIWLLDPTTLAELVDISVSDNTNRSPHYRAHLDSFFFSADPWSRIGISSAWRTEPKFRGIKPPSFPARRAMLFVHAVHLCLGVPIELVDSWKGKPITVELAAGPIAVQPTSELFKSSKLPDEFIRHWIAARGATDVEATFQRVKEIGYYGMFIKPSDTPLKGYVIGSVRFNTAAAL